MPSCLECFCKSGLTGSALQKFVDEQHPNFECEKESCSIFSPYPVSQDEQLAFILIDPLHYDQVRGIIAPDAFQELTRRDLSTLRVRVATPSQADAIRDQLVMRGSAVEDQSRSVNEVCFATVEDIRSAADGDGRYFAVYDTALANIPAHASIFTRSEAFENRLTRKKVRQKIHEIFTKHRVPYRQFMTSLAS